MDCFDQSISIKFFIIVFCRIFRWHMSIILKDMITVHTSDNDKQDKKVYLLYTSTKQ